MNFCVSKTVEKSRLKKKESVDSDEGLEVQRDWRELFNTPPALHPLLYYSIISLMAMYILGQWLSSKSVVNLRTLFPPPRRTQSA